MVRLFHRSNRHRSALVSSAVLAVAASFLGDSTGCNAMRGVNAPTDLLASSSVNRPQAIDMTAMNRTAPPQFASPQAAFAGQGGPQTGMAQPGITQPGMPHAGLPNAGPTQPGMPTNMNAGAIAQVSHAAPLPNACQVVIKDADGKTTRTTLPLDKQQHIQDLLVQSGALRQFTRMDIALLRTTPTGGKQRMNVEFDRSKRAVEMQYDYFIMPGDVLLVTEDPSTIVDDMIKKSGLVNTSSRRTNR
jgi:predicted small secreted protein